MEDGKERGGSSDLTGGGGLTMRTTVCGSGYTSAVVRRDALSPSGTGVRGAQREGHQEGLTGRPLRQVRPCSVLRASAAARTDGNASCTDGVDSRTDERTRAPMEWTRVPTELTRTDGNDSRVPTGLPWVWGKDESFAHKTTPSGISKEWLFL